MERVLIDYFANSLWQVPLLAGAAWFLIKMSKPQVRLEHGLWLGALLLAVVLPARGIRQDEFAGGLTGSAAIASGDAENVHFSGSVATPPAFAAVASRPAVVTSKTSGLAVAPPAVPGQPVSAFQKPASPSFVGSRSLDSKSSEAKPAALNSFRGLPLWVRVHRVPVTPLVLRGLCWIYLGAVAFGVLRLMRAWGGARRVVLQSTVVNLSARDSELLEHCCWNFDLRSPEVLTSDQVSSPVVVGVFRPRVLLPIDFAEYSDDEARAVLCHELAHIKRRDYLVNLLCQLAALPVSYHPATTAIQQRIRQTREMICDDLASAGMRPGYARCLVGLAQRMVAGRGIAEQVQAVGLFDNNKLEERVMRLMGSIEGSGSEGARAGGARTFRVVSGIAAMIGVIFAVAMFHVTPAVAGSPMPAPVARSEAGNASKAASPQVAPAPIAEPAPAAQRAPAAVVQPPAVSAEGTLNPAPAPVPGLSSPTGLSPEADPATTEPGRFAGLANRKKRTIVNGVEREMTPAELAHSDQERKALDAENAAAEQGLGGFNFEKQVAESLKDSELSRRELEKQLKLMDGPEFKKRMVEIQREVAKATARIDSPEFKKQMQEASKAWDQAALKKQLELGSKWMDNPEFKRQMAEAAKSWDQAAVKKQLEEMRLLNGPEFKKQMEDVQRQVADSMARMNGPELKALMEKSSKTMDSPEFKKRMEDAERRASEAAAQIDSPAFRQRMAEFEKQMHDGELERSMEAASKAMREAADQLKALQNQ